MKLIVIMSILTLIRAEAEPGVYVINGVGYEKEVIFENIPSNFNARPSSLAVDYNTNDLYVPFYIGQHKSAVFNINTGVLKYITGITNPQCITIDQVSHNVFIGTIHSIYKYSGTDAVERIGANGENIQSIYYYNGVLYYSKSYTGEIRTLVNGQSVLIHNFGFNVKSFVINKEENIFCISDNGSLYIHKKGTKYSFAYVGIPTVIYLTTDRNGNVYFSADYGIYEIKKEGVERVFNIDKSTNIAFVAFDNEHNLIYYNAKDLKLYKQKPTTNVTNICSDRHTSVQEREDTNNKDVKTELETLNEKVDNLTQIITLLLANIPTGKTIATL